MYFYNHTPFFMHSPIAGAGFGALLALAVVWSLVWKGWALWLAARRGEKVWFLVLLILNTVGILDIIYIFAIAKQKDAKPAKPAETK